MVVITELIRCMNATAVAAYTMEPWSHKVSGVQPFSRRSKARWRRPTWREGWTAEDHESGQGLESVSVE
jgi:hypothetical protein